MTQIHPDTITPWREALIHKTEEFTEENEGMEHSICTILNNYDSFQK